MEPLIKKETGKGLREGESAAKLVLSTLSIYDKHIPSPERVDLFQ